MSTGSYKVELLAMNFATLGEGPHWSKDANCLFHVDILGQRIFRFDPITGKNVASAKLHGDVTGTLSLVVPVKNSSKEFVISVNRSFYLATWDGFPESPLSLSHMCTVDEHSPTNRLNDGKCDPKGRLWAGTMGREDPDRPGEIELGKGALFRIDGRGCKKMVDGVDLSNGIEWSNDGKTMFFVDSLRYTVDAFDFDVEKGEVSNRRTVFDIKKSGIEGFLDGMTIDRRGHLWVAIFQGSKVLEILPSNDGGTVLGFLEIPEAQSPTSVAFGGEYCEDLYVTSARTGDPAIQKRLSGSLFRIPKLKSFADGRQCKGRPGKGFDARYWKKK